MGDMEAWDHEPEQPQDGCWDGYWPDDTDLARLRYLTLLPGGPEADGHWIDRQVDEFASRWDAEGDDLAQLYAAALFLAGWRLERRVPWPAQLAAPLVLAVLLALLAALAATRAATRPPPPDLTPAAAYVRARTVLTAAPPCSRAPVPAGAAA
jgi:hypothetical protein